MVGCAARAVHQQAQWCGRHRIAIGFRPLKLLHHQPIAAQSHDTVSALRVNKSEAVGQGEKKIALQGLPARRRLHKLTRQRPHIGQRRIDIGKVGGARWPCNRHEQKRTSQSPTRTGLAEPAGNKGFFVGPAHCLPASTSRLPA